MSTAPDIAHFWRGLLGGKLLEPAQLDAMKSTVPMEKGYPASYGLGIMKFDSACGAVWGNGGDIAGYSSLFQNSEDGKRQAGVIVNVNPIPKAVDGPFGAIKQSTISAALGSSKPCCGTREPRTAPLRRQPRGRFLFLRSEAAKRAWVPAPRRACSHE